MNAPDWINGMDCMASLIDSSTKCSQGIIVIMLIFISCSPIIFGRNCLGDVMTDHAVIDKYEGNHEDAEDVVWHVCNR